MNKLIVHIAFMLLLTVAGATPSNTTFIRTNIANGQLWSLTIYSLYNITYQLPLSSTANSITTNSFDNLYAALGIQQAAFGYIGSYTNVSGFHRLTQNGFDFASNNIV